MAEKPSTTNPELKPCPHCGGFDALARFTDEAGNKMVVCYECESTAYEAAWNRRAIEADLLEALRGVLECIEITGECLGDLDAIRAAIAKAEGR